MAGDELRDFLKLAKSAYKEQRKALKIEKNANDERQALLLQNQKLETDMAPVACIDCGIFLPLTSSVNQILHEMKLDEKVGVNEEIHALKASYMITKHFDHKTKKEICTRYTLKNKNNMDGFLLENYQSKLIFSKNMPIEKIRSLFLFKKENTHYFFRGAGKDADKVIEVVAGKDGEYKLNYYKISITQEERSKAIVKDSIKSYPDKDAMRTSGAWYNEDGISFGLAVDHEGYMPKKLKILDIDSTADAGYFDINSRLQVTSQKVGASFDFKEKGSEQNYATLKIKESGKAEVHVPTNFGVYFTDFEFKGTTKLTSKNEFGSNLKFSHGQTYLADIEAELGDDGNRYAVSHTRNLNNRTTMSVKFESENNAKYEDSRENIWLRLKVKF